MVYLDNAATTKYKPDEVYAAFEYYVRNIGVSPGRGSYQLGIEASRMLYQTRKLVANYFGVTEPNVIFTKNSTEAINLFFRGFLKQGDHVVISCYEHNAVLRPLHKMKEEGIIDYSVIERDDIVLTPEKIYRKYVRDNTALFEMTLASNLTGRIILNKNVLQFIKKKGITTFVDSSQGAGKISINMEEDGIDYLAFTGHKDLLALPGVGGLVCIEKPTWKPLIQGGTGVLGDEYTNPNVFPEGYEAGTLNMPAIWSLNASIKWVNEHRDFIRTHEGELQRYLLSLLEQLDNVIIYDKEFKRLGVLGINILGMKSSDVVQALDKLEICTRGGIHCAILAHEALRTKETGIVRLSLGWSNTKEEIDVAIAAIQKVGRINDVHCIL